MPEPEPDPYTQYRAANGVYYAWVVADSDLLTKTIPEDVKWSEVITGYDEQDEPITRQKTLDEYLMPQTRYEIDEGVVLFLLCARQWPDGRMQGVDSDDLALWDAHLSGYGYGATNWITTAEARELMPREDTP